VQGILTQSITGVNALFFGFSEGFLLPFFQLFDDLIEEFIDFRTPQG
jgi:hypothetical protein